VDGLIPEEISARDVVGYLQGNPVYHVSTIGGYNMILVLKDGRLEPLGVGPHPGVARGIARKREPSIQFHQLQKSDENVDSNGRVFQRYEAVTDHLRAMAGLGDR
jgi:hypothetical protein